MKTLMLMIAVCATLSMAGCGGSDDSSTERAKSEAESSGAGSEAVTASESPAEKPKPKILVHKGAPPKKLEVKELKKGGGPEAKPDDKVTVRYVGVTYKNGEQFYSTWDGGLPYSFRLGHGQVISGWEQGMKGMRVGDRRELVIPSNLAYGKAGARPTIGPDEALVLVVDLIAVKQ